MNRNTILLPAIAAAALVTAPFALAQGRQMTIDTPGRADLTMAQAVVIAESMANGRATRAQLDSRDAKPVYRVTVQPKGEARLKIDVAATDGRIVASERKDD